MRHILYIGKQSLDRGLIPFYPEITTAVYVNSYFDVPISYNEYDRFQMCAAIHKYLEENTKVGDTVVFRGALDDAYWAVDLAYLYDAKAELVNPVLDTFPEHPLPPDYKDYIHNQ